MQMELTSQEESKKKEDARRDRYTVFYHPDANPTSFIAVEVEFLCPVFGFGCELSIDGQMGLKQIYYPNRFHGNVLEPLSEYY